LKSKKIYLEITPFFPTSKHFFGPYIYDQANAIRKSGKYEVVIVKVRNKHNPERPDKKSNVYEYDGFKVYNLDIYDLPSSTLPGLFQRINFNNMMKLLDQTIEIKPTDIGVVHAHTVYPAGALAVELQNRFGIPALIQHHGLDVFQQDSGRLLKGLANTWNNTYKMRYFLNLVNNAALNIGVSQKVLNVLNSTEGFKNTSQYVLYNGVDINKFYSLNQEKSELFTIGCIGNFWPLKDHMTLLKAVNLLKERGLQNIRVKLIGTGPTLQECQAYIKEHGLSEMVIFEKELHHRELNAFYNSLDLFVLPSYYEAFGCVYTEAMQTGVPIIAVKGQGIEEVLSPEDKKLGLIEKGDYRHLADLIEFRYNHRSKVDYDFDIDQYITQFLQFLEQEILPKWHKGQR